MSFSKAKYRTQGILDYIHSNMWGPSKVPSLGGKRYMLTFVDDFTQSLGLLVETEK